MTKHSGSISGNNPKGIQLTTQRVDNPGAGNCAFYAFAIGLIEIIKEEHAAYGESRQPMFDQWVALDPSIKDLRQSIRDFDLKNQDKNLLERLQTSLRMITYQHKLTELRNACASSREGNRYKDLVATSSFVNFSAIYYGVPADTDPRFNEFANCQRIKDTVRKIDKKSVKTGDEELVFAPVFMRLLYGDTVKIDAITSETPPTNDSPVLEALMYVTQDRFWGTHLDLDYLANAFRVNLHVLPQRQKFVDIPERHTVTVTNEGNYHWTTAVLTAKFLEKELTTAPNKANENPTSITVPKTQTAQPSKDKDLSQKTTANPELISLIYLRAAVFSACTAYTSYSNNLWFSLFHRHGETGRRRALDFKKTFIEITDPDEAKKELIKFLSNPKNGNTHPHSFRTMLLKDVLKTTRPLNEVSKNYQHFLDKLNTSKSPAIWTP